MVMVMVIHSAVMVMVMVVNSAYTGPLPRYTTFDLINRPYEQNSKI